MKKIRGKVDLNQYKQLIMVALQESIDNNLLGSIGNEEAAKLYSMLKHEDYCIRHEISYDEMTDEDFENAAMEEIDRQQNEYDEI